MQRRPIADHLRLIYDAAANPDRVRRLVRQACTDNGLPAPTALVAPITRPTEPPTKEPA